MSWIIQYGGMFSTLTIIPWVHYEPVSAPADVFGQNAHKFYLSLGTGRISFVNNRAGVSIHITAAPKNANQKSKPCSAKRF